MPFGVRRDSLWEIWIGEAMGKSQKSVSNRPAATLLAKSKLLQRGKSLRVEVEILNIEPRR